MATNQPEEETEITGLRTCEVCGFTFGTLHRGLRVAFVAGAMMGPLAAVLAIPFMWLLAVTILVKVVIVLVVALVAAGIFGALMARTRIEIFAERCVLVTAFAPDHAVQWVDLLPGHRYSGLAGTTLIFPFRPGVSMKIGRRTLRAVGFNCSSLARAPLALRKHLDHVLPTLRDSRESIT